MQRPIELFALLDYIKTIIRYQEHQYLNHEPFETIFISYSGEPIISGISRDISNGNYIEALSQIHSYEQGYSQLHNIYLSIKKDFLGMERDTTMADVISLLRDKYGVGHSEEMAILLELHAAFIQEHELT
jgi:hypothetical protein